jgi:cytochrome P450
MDPQGMDAVMASKDNAADPDLKKRTLSQFVPDSLVVSSDPEWSVRREFNVSVLQFGERVHRHADAFSQVITSEVARFADERGPELRWEDFEALAERISHQVLLGQEIVDPEMTSQLAKVVKRSNWYVLPRNSAAFSAFYARLEGYLSRYSAAATSESASKHCLMADSAAALARKPPPSPVTRAPTQIGFWFFVIKDALELNVARTLALIAAHPDVYDRAQREIDAVQAPTAQAIDGLTYLEACIAEELRLWTPVPILLRRVRRPLKLRDDVVAEEGQQIFFHAGFYHRDAEYFGSDADKFSPKPRTPGSLPRLYSFSDGRQSCAGQFVARFLLKATLASLLKKARFEPVGPRTDTDSVPYLYDHFKVRLRVSPRR